MSKRGAYLVRRPDAEELAATKKWWERYNFTAESEPGVFKPCDQSYGCLAWWAYEREAERNRDMRKRVRKLESLLIRALERDHVGSWQDEARTVLPWMKD